MLFRSVERVGGVKYTIKDGVVYDAKKLLADVKKLVDDEKAKTGWKLKHISTLSWTLHDVQEPQSPEPVMTRSHSRASSSITCAVAGIDAPRLARLTMVLTP